MAAEICSLPSPVLIPVPFAAAALAKTHGEDIQEKK